jgi:hypothetical protein
MFEFTSTHFTCESWWCGRVLLTNVRSEVTLQTKLLSAVLALVVTHLQVDGAEVIVQCILTAETLVTCVTEMFGLSLILTTKIVSGKIVFLREDNSTHKALKEGVWINNRHIRVMFQINTKFFRVPFSIPYKKFFIGHDMPKCTVVYLSIILIGDQILFCFCTRAVNVSHPIGSFWISSIYIM